MNVMPSARPRRGSSFSFDACIVVSESLPRSSEHVPTEMRPFHLCHTAETPWKISKCLLLVYADVDCVENRRSDMEHRIDQLSGCAH